jgi:hypothetical protein
MVMSRYFMVHYRISDPKNFWNGVESNLNSAPAGTKIIFSAPNQSGSELTSLWEGADDPSALQQYLRRTAGSHANFETMEIDVGRAFGLPV